MMEYREDGLLVDYSMEVLPTGSPKQERELSSFDQESRLVRAMTELRPYTPSKAQWRAMSESERTKFRIFREGVFRKHRLVSTEFNL